MKNQYTPADAASAGSQTSEAVTGGQPDARMLTGPQPTPAPRLPIPLPVPWPDPQTSVPLEMKREVPADGLTVLFVQSSVMQWNDKAITDARGFVGDPDPKLGPNAKYYIHAWQIARRSVFGAALPGTNPNGTLLTALEAQVLANPPVAFTQTAVKAWLDNAITRSRLYSGTNSSSKIFYTDAWQIMRVSLFASPLPL